jgi:hypothetical protein
MTGTDMTDMQKTRGGDSGQSMVEFIIVTPIILLLLFGAFQFALIYHAKTALNYAAFEAARFGAVSNARMTEMENAFARSMAAIYTHNNTREDLICARETVRKEIETGFVNIEILNPTPEAFSDFGIDMDGEIVIPNDNLMYRQPIVGGTSDITIQDANLLKIRVGYCYPLYVPYINRVLGILLTNDESASCPGCTGARKDTGTFERRCLENGRFPINAQAIVRMQSAAMLSAVESGSAPGIASVSNEPFYQCDKSSFTVEDSMTPPDITTRTGFWTLSKQTAP